LPASKIAVFGSNFMQARQELAVWSTGWAHDPHPEAAAEQRETGQLVRKIGNVCKRRLGAVHAGFT